jgi:hypothetical protein
MSFFPAKPQKPKEKPETIADADIRTWLTCQLLYPLSCEAGVHASMSEHSHLQVFGIRIHLFPYIGKMQGFRTDLFKMLHARKKF